MSPIFSKIFSAAFLLYPLAAVNALPRDESDKQNEEKARCNADNALRWSIAVLPYAPYKACAYKFPDGLAA